MKVGDKVIANKETYPSHCLIGFTGLVVKELIDDDEFPSVHLCSDISEEQTKLDYHDKNSDDGEKCRWLIEALEPVNNDPIKLTGHKQERQTNAENIIAMGEINGGMGWGVIHEAIEQFRRVADMQPDFVEKVNKATNGLISGELWKDTIDKVADGVSEHLKQTT